MSKSTEVSMKEQKAEERILELEKINKANKNLKK